MSFALPAVQAADRAADQKKRAAFEKRWKESRQQTEAKHQAGKDKPEGSGRKVKMPQWHVSREDEAAGELRPLDLRNILFAEVSKEVLVTCLHLSRKGQAAGAAPEAALEEAAGNALQLPASA